MKRRAFMLASLGLAAGACTRGGGPVQPQEIGANISCALDGMLLKDYPGPKAQIHYAGQPEPDFFCDTVEMFSIYLLPETQRRIVAVYTQDMAKADWKSPQGQWIDARGAYYVGGSRARGAMGPTFAAFARREDADVFAQKNGGQVYAFAEVTADMADLRGGADHDQRM